MKYPSSYLLSFLLLLFVGCSHEIEIEEGSNTENKESVPILIMPERIGTASKTVVEEFTNKNVTNIGIYGTSNNHVLYNGISPDLIDDKKQLLFKNTPLLYPTDNNTVYLAGYYPCKSSVGNPYPIENDLVSFKLTGNEDLMHAAIMNAGNKSTPKAVNLHFTHKLTRVKFKLINGLGLLKSGKIAITTTAPNTGTLNLTDGTIVANSSTSTFTLPTDIDANSLIINTETSIEGDLLLIPSDVCHQDYLFKLTIDSQAYDIQIDSINKPKWEEGFSYLLTITIKALKDLPTKSNLNQTFSTSLIQGTITQL